MKTGAACLCCGDWTEGEAQALALYGALAQPTATCQVFAQIGQSLDGRIATETGDAQDVSGEDGLAHLHRLRALADAVVIGVKTALHDDPQLTVRLADGTSPARVVIDPDGRLPNDARLLTDTSARRIVIQAVAKERPAGVEAITLSRASWIAPEDILGALQERGFKSILIEGGGITITQFLEADLLNRLHLAIAPLLIGSGPQSLTTAPIGTLAEARRPKTDVYNLGSDVLFDCALSPADVLPIVATRCTNAMLTPLGSGL
ncbi:RibD family protein [Roseobacter sp. CCS2]|uniref:RibD family protein n=1 Tax=Roseobacter sp. CCS2 TaxID=391593 RepID=UPI0002DD8C76|nr:RibD family protein [Roseobacter sp. CCS2]